MDFPLTLAQSIAAFGIVVFGAALQGSIGFGLALVASPLLLLMDPKMAPGPVLIAALVLSAMASYRERHEIELPALKWALVGRVIGSAAGAALLSALTGPSVTVAVGALILLGVAMSALGMRVRLCCTSLFWAGTLSGFMGTTSAIGGPPMALIYQDAPGAKLRAMLSIFFVIGTIISIGLLVLFGQFGLAELQAGLLLVPGVLLGFALSGRLRRVLDRGAMRPTVLVVSAAAAIAAIVKSVL